MDKKFDLAMREMLFSSMLSRNADYAKLNDTSRLAQNMVWNVSGDLSMIMIEGTVLDYDPAALRAGYANMLKLINYSLSSEEWRKFVKWGEKHPTLRPEAWVCPNLALIDDRWWREGVIDKNQVAAIFDRQEDWGEGSTLVGIDTAERLLSIGAYHLIEPMQHTVNSVARFKRDFTPADRAGLKLAEDPGQLHDPKSPVRRNARSLMRKKMESEWFMRSGGWMPFHWLRTFEWREGESGLSPREAMLRAYAYMPDVEPPPNIAAEVATLRKIPI